MEEKCAPGPSIRQWLTSGRMPRLEQRKGAWKLLVRRDLRRDARAPRKGLPIVEGEPCWADRVALPLESTEEKLERSPLFF